MLQEGVGTIEFPSSRAGMLVGGSRNPQQNGQINNNDSEQREEFMAMIRPRVIDHGLMDAEHRTMSQWVQTAADHIQDGHDMAQTLYALDVLRSLAVSHFEHESREMQASGYPKRLTHAQDHEDMLGHLSLIRQAVSERDSQDGGGQRTAIAARLLRWFHAHIGAHDRHFASWLQQRTAASPVADPPGHGGRNS